MVLKEDLEKDLENKSLDYLETVDDREIKLLQMESVVLKYFDSLKKKYFDLMTKGVVIENLELKESNKRKVWIPNAINVLKEKIPIENFNLSISINEASKFLSKEDLEMLVHLPKGVLKLSIKT